MAERTPAEPPTNKQFATVSAELALLGYELTEVRQVSRVLYVVTNASWHLGGGLTCSTWHDVAGLLAALREKGSL